MDTVPSDLRPCRIVTALRRILIVRCSPSAGSAASNKGVDEAWNSERRALPAAVNSRGARKSQFSLPQDVHNEEMEAEEEEDDEAFTIETKRRTQVEDFDEIEEDDSARPLPSSSKVHKVGVDCLKIISL